MREDDKKDETVKLDKWSVPTLSYEQMMGVTRLVNEGKLKVDYVNKENE